jgi:hypothetical protein
MAKAKAEKARTRRSPPRDASLACPGCGRKMQAATVPGLTCLRCWKCGAEKWLFGGWALPVKWR